MLQPSRKPSIYLIVRALSPVAAAYAPCDTKRYMGTVLVRNIAAGVAQLVKYELPKLGVAGSNPVARSTDSLREA
jgi:hypothetical protein